MSLETELLTEILDELKEINDHLRYMDESCPGFYRSDSVHCTLCQFKYRCKNESEKESQY